MNPMDITMFQEIVLPLLGIVMGGGVLFGIYKTVNRHLDRQHQKELAGRGGSETQALVDALQEADRRIEELEERVDFAERVLSQREGPRALEGEG